MMMKEKHDFMQIFISFYEKNTSFLLLKKQKQTNMYKLYDSTRGRFYDDSILNDYFSYYSSVTRIRSRKTGLEAFVKRYR